MEQWVRLAVFGLILVSFLRRIFKARLRGNTDPRARAVQGKKNDFRNVPPPPENPELG
jgi:hypothetical protein